MTANRSAVCWDIADDLAVFSAPLDVRKVSGSNPLMSTSSKPVRNDGFFFVYTLFLFYGVKLF